MKDLVNVSWHVAWMALVHRLIGLQSVSIIYLDFCRRMIFWYESGDDGPPRAPYVVFSVMGLCWPVPLLERLVRPIEMRAFFHSIASASATKCHCEA